MEHDSAEHHTALYRGDVLRLSGDQFGIVELDSGSVDHHICAADVFGKMTHCDRNPVGTDPLQGIRFGIVRACDLIAFAVEDLSQRTHTRSADTDKMYPFYMIEKMSIAFYHKTTLPFIDSSKDKKT